MASPKDDTVTDQHKKAVIDELVNKITVRFDTVAKKHHVDVEFKSTVQPDRQGLSAKPANSGSTADPIDDPVGSIQDDDNGSDDDDGGEDNGYMSDDSLFDSDDEEGEESEDDEDSDDEEMHPGQAQPGHIEDRRKALLNARTSVEPYQGLDVADQEKQDGEPPMRT